MSAPVRLVTLATDIGASYAAQMKAVLARSLPPGHVVDLSHELPRHAIPEGAFLVRQMAAGFPPGTVHVVVVDPGVGGTRQRLVIACADGSRLVGPDNGILAPLAERLGGGTAYAIAPGRRGLPAAPSATFEGRDVFAPAAALLATGTAPEALGPRTTIVELRLPSAVRDVEGAAGEVLHVDRFGNLITNVPGAWLPRGAVFATLTLPDGPRIDLRIVRTYDGLDRGALGVLVSSFGTAEIAVREGSAAERTGLAGGRPFALRWRSGRPWAPPVPRRPPAHRPAGRARSQDGK